MSDFYHTREERKARKSYRCTWCSEGIGPGDDYVYQTGVHDGRWYTNRMHPECFSGMCTDGDFEFMPFSNERPSPDVP